MCHKGLSLKNGEGTIKTKWRVPSSLVGQIGLPAERDPLPLLLFRRRNRRHHHQHRRQKRRGARPQSPFVLSFPLLGGLRRAVGGGEHRRSPAGMKIVTKTAKVVEENAQVMPFLHLLSAFRFPGERGRKIPVVSLSFPPRLICYLRGVSHADLLPFLFGGTFLRQFFAPIKMGETARVVFFCSSTPN